MVRFRIDDPDIWKFDFDAAELKKKYLEERDKRLHDKRNDQWTWITPESKYWYLTKDPWVTPIERDAINEEVDVLVLGGGFSGIMTGQKLRDAGINSFKLIEKGGDFGGTWYWNRYPGAACDSESYCYLPLLEQTNYMPVEKYTRAPEILAHCRRMGEKWDLYPQTLFQTECHEVRWDESVNRWIAKTDRGDVISARFLISAAGPLHRPKLCGVPGIESYTGHTMHTSRWDYEYTGGDSYGNLHKLGDKRVAIVGTGATAVQVIPNLGKHAKRLYVFQRTPSSIDVRNNRPTDPEWVKSLKPGWQKERDLNFTAITSLMPQEVDLVDDGWTDAFVELFSLVGLQATTGQGKEYTPEELMQLADFRKMNKIRARVDSIVKDKATAEALKPWYNQFCKRPCFSDTYLDTFNQENVTLVDTDGKGIEGVYEKGIIANGKQYEVDCIVWATGFEVGTSWKSRNGFEVYGKNGISIADKWKDGVTTLYGTVMSDFPNYFFYQNSQAGAAVNFPRVYDDQSAFAVYCIKRAMDAGAVSVEVKKEDEENWVNHCIEKSMLRKKFLEDCTPGYYNLEGEISRLAARNTTYGAGPMVYRQVLEDWKAEGSMKGLELKMAA